jgi:ribosomal protein S18 acetylase RimI-like enzyme
VRIERVSETSAEIADAFPRLVPELSTSASVPTDAEIDTLVADPSTVLLAARSEANEIVGMLTLVLVRIPTGIRAWIEDVVVASSSRRSGVGAALVEEALRVAEANGARTVDLTSRPDREAANHLYLRMGFERRDTNVYRYDLADSAAGRRSFPDPFG